MNAEDIKKDFPIFKRRVRDDKPLVYLDNAATSQKPSQVIEAVSEYYRRHNSNVHRAVHALSEEATEMYEGVREQVKHFLDASYKEEIIFTRNTTESINLVAYSWGEKNINKGDEILLSEMEHHSNLIPWQILAERKGAKLKFIPVNDEGKLDLRNLKRDLNENTKLVSLVHASNFLGTLNDVSEIVSLAKNRGARILLDAAQSVPHLPVDVSKLGIDFFGFSAHKMLGPTGVGVLYVKREILEEMPPFMGGGSMIKSVDWEASTYDRPPLRFEAGTPNISGVVGFGAALDYLQEVGLENIYSHEKELASYGLKKFQEKGYKVFGSKSAEERVGLIAFEVPGIHSHDLATIVDEEGVAIRSGHHCVQPMHRKLGLNNSARASFYLYNTKEDVDALISAIEKAQKIFSV